ncbi:MAG: hypothetical protein ACKV19_21545 [Verrucomicrobiales bacterium]
MDNPYSPPQAPVGVASAVTTNRRYGGLRRVPYLALAIGLAVLQNVLVMVFTAQLDSVGVLWGIIIASSLLSLAPVYYRLKNIGMNPWWCLGALVPILNIFVGFRCLLCQEGYVETRKLDRAGRIMVWIILALMVLVVGAVIVSVALD